MLNEPKADEKEVYVPEQDERDFILKHHKGLLDAKLKKNESKKRLGHINLLNFWKQSNDNYDVILPIKEKGDWKRQAKRTITRDKANAFIAKLTKRIIKPQILAQNRNQQIDLQVSRALRILVEYVEKISKSVRIFIKAVHKCVIEGTVHVQIDVVNGQEVKTVLRNEEVFIPNEYQPDIQRQAHVYRAFITNYEEAQLDWGDNEKWKYVHPGASDNWGIEDEYFIDYNSDIVSNDDVLIIYAWEHTGYYKEGDKAGKPKPKKFNVFINGIPMYDIDNEMNLKHNRYPIAKTIFEMFSESDYYWGNSLPNKIRHDQSYLDAFRTILLNKAILNLLPPLFNKGQEHLDEDVIVPGKVTTTENEQSDIYEVPGVSKPITGSDINIEQNVERGVDEGTQPPVSLGQEGPGAAKTLGEIQLKDARANELMEIFGRMISFLVEDMGEQTVSNVIQFETRKRAQAKLNEEETDVLYLRSVDVPEQTLRNGETGVVSLQFGEKHPDPLAILEKELESERQGQSKEIIYMNPNYLDHLDTFVFVEANPATKPSEELERLMTTEKYIKIYRPSPLIDQKEALRDVIRANQDDETRLLLDKPPVIPGAEEAEAAAGGAGSPGPGQRLNQSQGQQVANAAPSI